MADAPPDVRLRIFRAMQTMFLTDEKLRSLIGSGQLLLQYYSPRGQEAIPAAVSAALEPGDYMVTTYRGMYDAIAKGVSLRDILAEYLGRAAGPCGGKGGPMHLTDAGVGLMCTTGIVGSGLPIANGLALSSIQKDDGKITLVNFGDGASNIGAFHEALNLAAVWNLPVVFLCTNNGYGEHTRFEDSTRAESVAARGVAYGVPGETVEGRDTLAVYDALRRAVDRARGGQGPTLLEATAFRFFGHYFGDSQTYVDGARLAAEMANDPVPAYRARLLAEGHAETELDAIDAEIAAAIDDALAYAKGCAPPEAADVSTHVFATAAGARS
jgi:pyruvate dehydrogenase E1 component alpha subunit